VTQTGDREITSAERIRRIIGILRLDGREVELHLPQYIEVAKISNTTHDNFTVKLSTELINLEYEDVEYVYINFVFSGAELMGKCRFVEQTRAFITLTYPETLTSRSKRKYPRVKLKELLPAKLNLKDFPEKEIGEISSRKLPVKYSKIYWEVQREVVDIKKVFLMVGKELKMISPYSEVIIYNNENKNTRDASIMRRSGKILFIDDCRKVQSYTRFIPSDKIINYGSFLNEYKLKGVLQEELVNELKSIIKEDLSQGFTSKVLIPVFSGGGVIGHIRAVQKEADKKITSENISDLSALSILMSAAMEKAKYTPELDDAINSSLVDISEGGLFLRVVNNRAEVSIPEGASIEVKFVLGEKEVILKGNVCRKNEEEKSYAIKFLEIGEDEKKLIRKFVDQSIEKFSQNK